MQRYRSKMDLDREVEMKKNKKKLAKVVVDFSPKGVTARGVRALTEIEDDLTLDEFRALAHQGALATLTKLLVMPEPGLEVDVVLKALCKLLYDPTYTKIYKTPEADLIAKETDALGGRCAILLSPDCTEERSIEHVCSVLWMTADQVSSSGKYTLANYVLDPLIAYIGNPNNSVLCRSNAAGALSSLMNSHNCRKKLLDCQHQDDQNLLSNLNEMLYSKSSTTPSQINVLRLLNNLLGGRLVSKQPDVASTGLRAAQMIVDIGLLVPLNGIFRNPKSSPDVLAKAFFVVFVLSHYENVRGVMVETGLAESLQPFLTQKPRLRNVGCAAVTIANLVGADSSSGSEVLTTSVMSFLSSTIVGERVDRVRFEPWTILEGIEQLAINGDNNEVLLKNGLLGMLSVLLKDPLSPNHTTTTTTTTTTPSSEHETTETTKPVVRDDCIENDPDISQIYACRVLQRVSHVQATKEMVVCDGDIMGSLIHLFKTSTSERARTAAKSTMFVLQDNGTVMGSERKSPIGVRSGALMLSYASADKKVALQMKKALHKRKISSWMSLDNTTADPLDAMVCAVQNCTVVLVLESNAYEKSRDCQLEASFALKCKKLVIPVRVEHKYVPDGWLGELESNRLYVDFSRPNCDFDTCMSALAREFPPDLAESFTMPPVAGLSISQELSMSPRASYQAKRMRTGISLAGKDIDEVAEWLVGVGLGDFVEGFKAQCMGEGSLSELTSLARDNPDLFHTLCRTDLGMTTLGARLRLSYALKQAP